MMQRAYSIFDRKALIYHPPFFAVNDRVAERTIANVANDPNTSLGQHPNDFVLYCIGGYNDEKGELMPLTPLLHVCDVMALVTKQPDIFPKAAS